MACSTSASEKFKDVFPLISFHRYIIFSIYLCIMFFDPVRNQTLNRKFLLELIQGRAKFNQRNMSRQRTLNFDE